MVRFVAASVLLGAASLHASCNAFAPVITSPFLLGSRSAAVVTTPNKTLLHMAVDPVTYLRTEFVSAALFTNQIPRSADTCVQLGTYDGRVVSFIPRTVRTFIPSSLQPDGKLDLKMQRAMKQTVERRTLDDSMKILSYDQRADNLSMVKDNSVDVVVSMQSAEKMVENGLDWKQGIREAGRVLKPGGRFLFVEKTVIGDESYLDVVGNLSVSASTASGAVAQSETQEEEDDDDDERLPLFESVGWDDVDFVVTPHVAGVFVKRLDAGMTKQERLAAEKQKEKDMYAERSISAFERGRKRKKKKGSNDEATKEQTVAK